MKESNLEELVKLFSLLPGVGTKTATRYAYFVASEMDKDDVNKFSKCLVNVKETIHHCPICNKLTEGDLCEICSDTSRDQTKILVVKDTKEVNAIEKSHTYKGMYHVLGNLISPLDGIGPSEVNIDSLIERVKSGMEIILATPFNAEGETTALYIERLLDGKMDVKVSRIGYGLPFGADIVYADELTIAKAIERRNIIK